MAVILADNILENPIKEAVDEFKNDPVGARIFLTTVKHPEWYGVVTLGENNCVEKIEEKPKKPESNWVATGIYMYDSSVWERIAALTPSARGELEITDLNNMFLKDGTLKAHTIEGFWYDAGESLDVYAEVCHKVYEWHQHQKTISDWNKRVHSSCP